MAVRWCTLNGSQPAGHQCATASHTPCVRKADKWFPPSCRGFTCREAAAKVACWAEAAAAAARAAAALCCCCCRSKLRLSSDTLTATLISPATSYGGFDPKSSASSPSPALPISSSRAASASAHSSPACASVLGTACTHTKRGDLVILSRMENTPSIVVINFTI